MKALVLSGGGAHGAYEAGVAKALLQRENFDLICGVSIGAINAALLAAGTDDALEEFWHSALPTRARKLFPHIPRLRRIFEQVTAIGHGGPWHDAMRLARAASEFPFLRNLGRVHRTTLPEITSALAAMLDFSSLRAALLIGATNVSSGGAAVFRAYNGWMAAPDHHSHVEYRDLDAENFVIALLASAAMPGLFSPIELTFDGKSALYADGCIVHNSPLGLAIDNGATEVTVIFVDPEPTGGTISAEPDLGRMAHNIATLWQQRMLDYELRLAQAMNEIVRLGGATDKREISIRYVRPEKPLMLDMLAFDDGPALARAFDLGMQDGSGSPHFKLSKSEPEVVSVTIERPGLTGWLRGLIPGMRGRFTANDRILQVSPEDDSLAS